MAVVHHEEVIGEFEAGLGVLYRVLEEGDVGSAVRVHAGMVAIAGFVGPVLDPAVGSRLATGAVIIYGESCRIARIEPKFKTADGITGEGCGLAIVHRAGTHSDNPRTEGGIVACDILRGIVGNDRDGGVQGCEGLGGVLEDGHGKGVNLLGGILGGCGGCTDGKPPT